MRKQIAFLGLAMALFLAGAFVNTSADLLTQKPAGIFALFPVDAPSDYSSSECLSALRNPAISGVAIRERWSNLEQNEGTYDFSRVENAIQNSALLGKKVQLILVPGFFTPKWVLDKIPPCEDANGAIGSSRDCGKAIFAVPYGPNRSETRELPLPWNPVYKQEWLKFLKEAARRYNSNETVVSIAIAGPTSVSAEMSLPKDTDKWRQILNLFYPDLNPENPKVNPNLPIISEWKQAIVAYGEIFRGKTLVVTRGSGLLKFRRKDEREARSQIVAYFADKNTSVGENLKATQTSGLKASRETAGGIQGVKELSEDPLYSPRILGGAQFDTSVTRRPDKMGSTVRKKKGKKKRSDEDAEQTDANLTPEEALRNVLKIYFDRTPFGESFGGASGKAPMHYLQIYKADVLYANEHLKDNPAFQNTLLDASRKILQMSRL